MVDLGISRTQDLQNPLPVSSTAARLSAEVQDRSSRPQALKTAGKSSAEPSKAIAKQPVNLDSEVRRLNDLLGNSTRIQFVINRTNNDVYIEVVDKESNKVLKTIPPSELAPIAGKLLEGGILVDNRS